MSCHDRTKLAMEKEYGIEIEEVFEDDGNIYFCSASMFSAEVVKEIAKIETLVGIDVVKCEGYLAIVLAK